MLAHAFVQNAYLAGTFIALACGVLGWFVVLRAELFAADALAHVAFVGAIAAAVVGIDERLGLFALTLASAAGITVISRRGHADDVLVGISFAWILGIGILLITLLATTGRGGYGITAANALFGSIYSLTAASAAVAAAVAVGVVAAALAVFRPLLTATLDPELAVTRGIPVRLLGAALLVLLAALTAEGTQAIGALLLLGLLAAPAGAARCLVTNPFRGAALASLFALVSMWGGLAVSYALGSMPPSSAIVGIAAAIYGIAAILKSARSRRITTERLLPAHAAR